MLKRQQQITTFLPGGWSEREPPDPIPNSEVKLLSADGSVGFPPCESRSLPGISFKNPVRGAGRIFFCESMVRCGHRLRESGLPRAQSDANCLCSLARIPGFWIRRPTSRLRMSEVQVRFSDPMKARDPVRMSLA